MQALCFCSAALVVSYISTLGDKAAELADPALQGRHYAALQDKFGQALPDYAMPQLMGYSVYRLVGHKQAQHR